MRVLIGLIEHIGDIIACEPVSRYVRNKYPEATISWAVRKPYRELIDTNSSVDETIVLECLTDWMKLVAHESYDQVIDLHVNYRVCGHCRIPLIKKTGNPFVNAHEWFDHGALLEAFSQGAGLPKLTAQPLLYLDQKHAAAVDRLGLPEKFCVFHRESNEDTKDWKPEKWRKLAEWVRDELGLPIIEIGVSKSDAASPLASLATNLLNKTSLLETAEILRRAQFFVAIDSGPAHMANALGVPSIILLGRYKVFSRYTPFTGFFASASPAVRVVQNLGGPAAALSVDEIIEATKYVAGIVQERLQSGLEKSRTIGAIDRSIFNRGGAGFEFEESDLAIRAQENPPFKYDSAPSPGTSLLCESSDEIRDETNIAGENTIPRAFAFYLPQFHPIAENDFGHRAGFTEWDNVVKATPLFHGHYQPRIPGELGYYDLRATETILEQVQLAKEHGLSGFCFYYYYFAGKRLLYKPIENYIKSDTDFPFFFLWANENWTRRWDGGDHEVIVSQQHSAEDDRAFIRGLADVFADPRYTKIAGKPILLIYKAHLFPDILASTELWREEIVAMGFPGIYLVLVDDWTQDPCHPRSLGFDASYEIPSNYVSNDMLAEQDSVAELVEDFDGRIVDYRKFSKYFMGRPFPEYKRFRTVMLPWDNTPRYRTRAMVHINADNDSYQQWLTQALLDTYNRYEPEERIVFVHSWNEWCEGTYLEPDGRLGRRYLEQTKNATDDVRKEISYLRDGKTSILINRVIREKDENAFRVLNGLRSQLMHSYAETTKLRSEFYSSTSWRITWPIRWLARRLGR